MLDRVALPQSTKSRNGRNDPSSTPISRATSAFSCSRRRSSPGLRRREAALAAAADRRRLRERRTGQPQATL